MLHEVLVQSGPERPGRKAIWIDTRGLLRREFWHLDRVYTEPPWFLSGCDSEGSLPAQEMGNLGAI